MRKMEQIIVLARSLNEEANVRRFVESYQWADHIFIADSGSKDNTVAIANEYDNVICYFFGDKAEKGTVSRPPHGKHINSLIEMAELYDPDWIIFDDMDCVPTRALRKNARKILRSTDQLAVFAYRMYIYGSDKWFPEQNIPGQSLWAWRPDAEIHASERDPFSHEMLNIPQGLMLDYPQSLLHFFAPDEETIQQKLEFYNSYKEQESRHPLEYCGKLEDLPEWATI